MRREYYLLHQERISKKNQIPEINARRKENKLKWQIENDAYRKQYAKNYRKKNKEHINFKNRTRKAMLKQRIPRWANLDEIRSIYLNCPENHHVDHIIPLCGDIVCGLHVEYNLQYLPAIENIRKHNLMVVS